MASRFSKSRKGKEAVAGIEALLTFPMAALRLAVAPLGVRRDQLVPDAGSAAVFSKRAGISRLLLENRFVNAKPLSVWIHSTSIPRGHAALTDA